ncbi:MAG: hypothetical protein IH840_14615 [Candidatus Heimdallarchaeota archaeon]|nr:hypothetical protein [Candidatus Heimdallarchaeota archaeon]
MDVRSYLNELFLMGNSHLVDEEAKQVPDPNITIFDILNDWKATSLAQIQNSPPGSILFSVDVKQKKVSGKKKTTYALKFLLREKTKLIKRLKVNPIGIRSKVLPINLSSHTTVDLIAIILKLRYKKHQPEFFESWLNIAMMINGFSFGRLIKCLLLSHDRLTFQFIGDSKSIEKTVRINNNKQFWEYTFAQISHLEWKFSDYTAARHQMFSIYQSPNELYAAMKGSEMDK